MNMWTKLICFCLVSSAFGQVTPTHVLATEYLADPAHPEAFVTFPSTGADSYKVYEALNNNFVASCPVFGSTLTQTQVWPDGSIHRAGSPAYVLDTTIPGGIPVGPYSINYTDDPYPGLSQIPATSLGGKLGWCYAVSSVVNGVESARSVPQVVWIGFVAYYAWSYHTNCDSAQLPYPYPPTAFHPQLFYRDPSGVNHSFNYYGPKVVVAGGIDEIEFHLPVIANDGTMVPLLDASANGKAAYYIEWTTPDGYTAFANILPFRQGDRVYYNEISTGFVLGQKAYYDACPSSATWWQDTSY